MSGSINRNDHIDDLPMEQQDVDVDDDGDNDTTVRDIRPNTTSTTPTLNDTDNNNNNKSNHHQGYYLSAFAMGTGWAGPIGFLWKIGWNQWIGISVSGSLFLAAIVLSIAYGLICTQLVQWSYRIDILTTTTSIIIPNDGTVQQYANIQSGLEEETSSELHSVTCNDGYQPPIERSNHNEEPIQDRDGLIRNYSNDENDDEVVDDDPTRIIQPLQPQSLPTLPALNDLSLYDRFRLLLHMCWIYMIPLFVVYAAEYACQAGAWTTIGFPSVTDTTARIQFFERSNWLYQMGVLVSRSTGSIFSISIIGLWIMPALQILNLIIFSVTASTGIQVPRSIFYHQSILLPLSFITGLLGGAVYVHGYNRIVRDVPSQYTEFAVASTSVAVSFGVLVADIMGLYLQSCLYQSNGLDGAIVQCPL
jgi:hypothetical protein